MTQSAWLAVGLSVWILAQAHAEEVAPAAVTATANRWVAQLESPDFEARETAQAELTKLGISALPALTRAAKEGPRETAIRAADLLAKLYRDSKFPEGADVEQAISELRSVPGAVGEVAWRSWDANVIPREKRTIVALEKLGARVQFTAEEDPRNRNRNDDRPPAIQFIVISRKWQGGDEGLKLLEQLPRPTEIQVYHVNGAQVSDEAMQSVADLGYKVDRRGAFLGISSGSLNGVFIPRDGCHVGGVSPGSPAAVAGLLRDDRIVQFGEHEITDFEDLIGHLKQTEPGDKVQVGIIREGKPRTVEIVLGNW